MIKTFSFRRSFIYRNPLRGFKNARFFSQTPDEELKKKLLAIKFTAVEKNYPQISASNKYLAFDNKMDTIMFNSQYRFYQFNSVIWLVIGTLTFIYIHPLASFIPAWISSGNIFSTFLTNKFAKTLVYKIMLSEENKNLAHIFIALKQKEIVCQIKNIQLKEIKEIEDADKKMKYVITFETVSAKQKIEKNLKIYLDLDRVRVENIDLFNYIMTSDSSHLSSFEKKIDTEDLKQEKTIDS